MDILRLTSSIKDLKSINLWQSLVAEFLGTFLLAFIGFGSVYSNMNPVKVGLGFGLAGVVIIYCIGPTSGGHINPAVSFGLLIARQISLIRCVLYFLVQVIGATAGFKLISILTKGKVLNMSHLSVEVVPIFKKTVGSLNISNWNLLEDSINITEKIDKVNDVQLKIFCELVISFVLVFTVMRLCVEKSRSDTEKGLAPLIIGLSITVGVYCGINISGGSMNPAVSLGKYICTGSKGIKSHIIGPLVGGLLAGLLQQLVFTSSLSIEHIKLYLFSSEFENINLQKDNRENDIHLSDVEKHPNPKKHRTEERYSPKVEHDPLLK